MTHRPALAVGFVTVCVVVVVRGRGWTRPREADEAGVDPQPAHLVRPPVRPLTPVARLGREVFFDSTLSASGRMSCATCHSPAHAYGPPDGRAVRLGGSGLDDPGLRAVPSLRYLGRVPPFGFGTAVGDADEERPPRQGGPSSSVRASRTGLVPRGGLFWDGRAGTLQSQTMGPLLNAVEMANRNVDSVADRLRRAPYGKELGLLFGEGTVSDPRRLVDEAMFAVARFELEDPSFHPYSSKYDAWLEGKARLSPTELRGLRVFEDPKRGNCAECHLDRPGPDGRPPTFTDYEFEALGVPRNDALAVNRDPRFHDLGLCGPARTDLAGHPPYCGLFRTPSLRNVATRHVFFHNGVYHRLQQVLDFYAFRDARPGRVYPRGAGGRIEKFDDLPARYRANVDTVAPPFDRHAGDPPALSSRDIHDLAAFLRTLTDGYPRSGR